MAEKSELEQELAAAAQAVEATQWRSAIGAENLFDAAVAAGAKEREAASICRQTRTMH